MLRYGMPAGARLAVASALTVALTAAGARAALAATGFFETPSGNIVCLYGDGPGVPTAFLECGVASGLHPAPSRNAADCKVLDYTANRVSLSPDGRATAIACSGDAGPFAAPAATPVLAYGTVWRGGGFSCLSARVGLTCRNARRHGFFLSRASWRGF